jgi:O-antigen ligase
MQTVLATGWSESQAQNGYLDLLLQLGLVGLIPMIVVLLRALAQAAAAFQRKTMNDVTFLAIVMLTLILVENIGESWLLVAVGMPWLYALIALLILSRPDRYAEEC